MKRGRGESQTARVSLILLDKAHSLTDRPVGCLDGVRLSRRNLRYSPTVITKSASRSHSGSESSLSIASRHCSSVLLSCFSYPFLFPNSDSFNPAVFSALPRNECQKCSLLRFYRSTTGCSSKASSEALSPCLPALSSGQEQVRWSGTASCRRDLVLYCSQGSPIR